MSSPSRPPQLLRAPDAPTLPSQTPRRPTPGDRRQSPNTSLTSIGSASSQLPPLSGIGLTPWARRSDPSRLITTPGLMAMGGLITSPSFTPDMQISASAPGFGPSPIRSPSVRTASSGSHSSPPSASATVLHAGDSQRLSRAPSRAGSESALPTPQAEESALPTPREMAAKMPDSPRGDTSHRLPGLGHLLKPSQSQASGQSQSQSQGLARPHVVPYAPRPLRRGPDDSQCTDADASADADADAEGEADMSGEPADRSADQSQADLVGLGVVLDAHQRRCRQAPRASSPLRPTLPAAPRLGSSDQGRFANVLELYPDEERVLLPRPVPHAAAAPTQFLPQNQSQPPPHPPTQPPPPAQQAPHAASWGPSPKRMDPAAYPRMAGLSGLGLTFDEHDLPWRPVEQEWSRWPQQGEMTPHVFGELPLEAGVGMMPIPVDRVHLHPSPMGGNLSLPSPTGTMLESPAVGWSPLPDEKGAFAAAKQAVLAAKKPTGSYRVQSKARSAALVKSTAAAFEAHAAAAPKGAAKSKRKQPLGGEEQSPWGVFSLNPKKSGWKPLFPPGIRPPVLAVDGAAPAPAPAQPPPKKARVEGKKVAAKLKPTLAVKVNRV